MPATSTSPAPSPARELRDIPTAKCYPRPGNRNLSRDPELAELADSIRVLGLLNAIVVVEQPDGRFEIAAGVRRWTAHTLIGLETISAKVHPMGAPADEMRVAENAHRLEAGLADMARSLRQIKNRGGYSHEEVAQRTGVSLSRVRRYLSLFQCSDKLFALIEGKGLSVSLALALMKHEKVIGEAATRRLFARAGNGELTAKDVDRLRSRAQATKSDSPSEPTRSPRRAGTVAASAVDGLRRLARRDPKAARAEFKRLQMGLAELSKEWK